MPLLDSFKVDHTKMTAPAVRVAKTMTTTKGDIVTVYDLRLYQPNKAKMTGRGIHTLEHLFAGFIRNHLNNKNVEIIEDKSYTTLLSGYDLCRLPMLDRWVETGVSAFKIEGRMKNSYYIANVVRVYRYALDKIAKGEFSKNDIEYGLRELDKMAHREFSLNLQSKPFMKARENKDIYIGDVLYNIGEDDSYVVARGRIEVGKEYEVLLPGNEIKNSRVIVRKIYRNGKEVSRAGGGEVYRIIFDGKVYPKTILRRVI